MTSFTRVIQSCWLKYAFTVRLNKKPPRLGMKPSVSGIVLFNASTNYFLSKKYAFFTYQLCLPPHTIFWFLQTSPNVLGLEFKQWPEPKFGLPMPTVKSESLSLIIIGHNINCQIWVPCEWHHRTYFHWWRTSLPSPTPAGCLFSKNPLSSKRKCYRLWFYELLAGGESVCQVLWQNRHQSTLEGVRFITCIYFCL